MLIFKTKRLTVRNAVAENKKDIAVLLQLWNDAETMKLAGFPEGLKTTPEKIVSQLRRQDDVPFNMTIMADLSDTGETIGHGLMRTPEKNGVAVFDIKLLPQFRGRGLAVEFLSAMLDYMFNNSYVKIVEGTPNKENAASIKMQERCGLLRTGEGVYEFPEKMRSYTNPVAHYIYRITRKQWEQLRAAQKAA
jgi:RimJ/RimL family protein N-acetyltransferase